MFVVHIFLQTVIKKIPNLYEFASWETFYVADKALPNYDFRIYFFLIKLKINLYISLNIKEAIDNPPTINH